MHFLLDRKLHFCRMHTIIIHLYNYVRDWDNSVRNPGQRKCNYFNIILNSVRILDILDDMLQNAMIDVTICNSKLCFIYQYLRDYEDLLLHNATIWPALMNRAEMLLLLYLSVFSLIYLLLA